MPAWSTASGRSATPVFFHLARDYRYWSEATVFENPIMNDLQTDSEVSVTRLVSGIITDTQKLIKQQLALLRHEVKDNLHKIKEAGLSLIGGSVIALVGGIFLAFMLV